MEAFTRQSGKVVILDLAGDVNLFGSTELKKILNGFLEKGQVDVLVNFERVSHIDSAGLGALISFLTQLKKAGGDCKLVNVQGAARLVFELTRLRNLFEIFDSEDEALASF